MIRNYLTIAFRSLLKNKTFSLINVIGLAIGTLCCLYIVLYVREQYSYDKHHINAKDIYRINSALVLPGDKQENMATASPPVAPAMKNDFGEVEQFTRVVGTIGISQHLLRYQEKSFYEKEAVFVDSTFFDVFTYHFVKGSAAKSLTDPYTVVLLKPTADKLFGNDDPIGKTFEIDNGYGKNNFKVTGVVDESLGKSHINANVFITMNSGGIGRYVLSNTSWAGNNFAASYVKLNSKANATALEKKLPDFLLKYGQQQLKEFGMQKVLQLQPVSSIHTTIGYNGENYKGEMSKAVNPSFLYILLLIAALIQLIACINFMNLSTARASKRAKEVGVRKVIGAERKDLIKQFLGESFLLSLLAVLLALPLLWLTLPYLNQITKADIQLSLFLDYRVWLMLASLVLVTGLIAGSYPAFYLSAFKAIKVIKGNFTSHISVAGIRRSLVVFQFVLSIILITGIIIIYYQLNYIKNKDLGFAKDQTLVFSFHTNDSRSKMKPFINELNELPEVKAVSKTNNYLSQFVWNDIGVFLAGGNMTSSRNAPFMISDKNFVKANGIKIVSGRDFRLFDSSRVLINETLAKQLGLKPQAAPGTKLYSQQGATSLNFEIAGVMKDFNYTSLHEPVKPFMLLYSPDVDAFTNSELNIVIVSINSKNYKQLIEKIGAIWDKHLRSVPFEYSFLDQQVQKQYETEIILSRIINSFTIIAIFISCLGLFGLAAFSAEQRRKEIGIRKVLGANASGIVQLLSKDFLKLVFIAILISTPIAWWVMNKWLQAFAYKIDLGWWMFATAGIIAIAIALVTVSFQAIKAAVANPVKSLRTE
jgi:putative ABC transport system permease protein